MLMIPKQFSLSNNWLGFSNGAIKERISNVGRLVFGLSVQWHIFGSDYLHFKWVQKVAISFLEEFFVSSQLDLELVYSHHFNGLTGKSKLGI